eukprot:gene5742-6931_t
MKPEDVDVLDPMEDSTADNEPLVSVPTPYLHRMALCVAAAGLIVIGIWTTAYFFESDWAVYGSSGMVTEWNYTFGSGYTKNQYWALWSATIVAPAAVVGILLVSQQVYSLALYSEEPKIAGGAAAFFFLAAGGFTAGAYFSYEEWSGKLTRATAAGLESVDWVDGRAMGTLSVESEAGETPYGWLPSGLNWCPFGFARRGDAKTSEEASALSQANQADTEPDAPASRLATAMVVIWLFPLLAYMTTFIPNSWEAVTGSLIYEDIREPTKTYDENGEVDSAPEVSYAVFETKTFEVATDSDETLYFRLYPDVWMYWTFIYAVVLTGLLGRASRPVRQCLKAGGYDTQAGEAVPEGRPVRQFLAHRPAALRGHATCGGLVLLSYFSVLLIVFTYYWIHDHAWHSGEDMPANEQWARTFGQDLLDCGVFNCIHDEVSASAGQVEPGYATVVFFLALLLAALELILASRLLAQLQRLLKGSPTPLRRDSSAGAPPPWQQMDDENMYSDNFTIALATYITFPMFIINGVFSHYTVRRRNFELFYFSHYYFMAVYIMILWHATSAWFFVLPGLALWFWDRMIRVVRSNSVFVAAQLEPCAAGTVVHVEFEQVETFWGWRKGGQMGRQGLDPLLSSFPAEGGAEGAAPDQVGPKGSCGSFKYKMGQYAFINVPEISWLEWHPFSISSAPVHIYLGYMLLVVIMCHIGCWWTTWDGISTYSDCYSEDGSCGDIFPENIYRILGYFPTNSFSNHPHQLPAVCDCDGLPPCAGRPRADGRAELHIKDMGAGTFTRALLRLGEGAQRAPAILVDGPYGVPLAAYDYKRIVLVAGGIGITALHSIFRELYAAVQKKRYHTLETGSCTWEVVKLIWVVRDMRLLEIPAFRSTLSQVLQNDVSGVFSVQNSLSAAEFFARWNALCKLRFQVFCTNAEISPSIPADLRTELKSIVHLGRPDLKSELARDLTSGMDSIVYACGPEGLVDSASEAALSFGVDFRKEIFAF